MEKNVNKYCKIPMYITLSSAIFGAALCRAESGLPWIHLLLQQKNLPFGTVESAGQVWMDRNLGASRVAMSLNDPFAFGDLYQWGRGSDGHEKRTSGLINKQSETDTPGHGKFIYNSPYPRNWRKTVNPNLWQGTNGINNPCPLGFRVPTRTELEIEMASWQPATRAGAFSSPLRLITAGSRAENDGAFGPTEEGAYWSSTVYGGGDYNAILISFSDYYSSIEWVKLGHGFSVRCIQD
jgi:hypothetical protein